MGFELGLVDLFFSLGCVAKVGFDGLLETRLLLTVLLPVLLLLF